MPHIAETGHGKEDLYSPLFQEEPAILKMRLAPCVDAQSSDTSELDKIVGVVKPDPLGLVIVWGSESGGGKPAGGVVDDLGSKLHEGTW